jgi:hypothetical protein
LADRVVVLGGYGVFGGRLSRRLVEETKAEIVVAGRSPERAAGHCRKFGGTPLALDREDDLTAAFLDLKPKIVIDAAGPFQSYRGDRYRVARAAIAAGAHYVDLADDAEFVAGIEELDDLAEAAGVCVVSGASSVPAVSSAALDELTRNLTVVSVVGSAILPGNRAPRGLSVVRAIVSQAGRPFMIWRGGRWTETSIWSEAKRFDLAVAGTADLTGRLASPIGAPDLLLFPERYNARSALFHAGLELRTLQLGLRLLAWPVRLGIVKSIEPLAPVIKWIADCLERFGSDRGGMVAYAIGRDADGQAVERRWTLIAESGDGPDAPPTPALLIARKLLDRGPLEAGAAPALGMLTLEEIEAGLSGFRIRCAFSERPAPTLMERVLGADFVRLPPAMKRLAEVHDVDRFVGVASVERGAGLLSRLIGKMIGFPPATDAVEVEVIKTVTAAGENWTRRFGDRSFVSHLSHRSSEPGILRERFGPMSFSIRLTVDGERVMWPVERWRYLGLPMPRALRPKSDSIERVDEQGRFRFRVEISLPVVGFVVRYQGWLEPAQAESSTAAPASAPNSRQA